MCGIFGIIHPQLCDQNKIQSSAMLIKHRGPDNTTINSLKELYMCFHRLTINGLGSNSNQPFINDDVYLMCNGEIYNHKNLEKQYGFTMKTNSDCEIILHMYKRFGIRQTIEELDGEFSFILYDKYTKMIYTVRDHIGIRPLFLGLSDKNKSIGFASEAKALIPLYDDIAQFPPGQYFEYHINTHIGTFVKWYDFDKMDLESSTITPLELSRDQLLTVIHQKVIDSVNDRINLSDVKVGTFLSGGLDSSIVTALAYQTHKDIECFSIGIEGSLDLKASVKVAEHLGLMNHHIVKVTLDDAIGSIEHVIKTLETYDITTIRASTFQWLLSKYISENTNVKVLLSGEVPDEIIPGYWAFAFCESDDEFKKMSQTMMEELHEYDLLRTDRTTAHFGLEVRVPFAEKSLLSLFHNTPVKYRRFDKDTIEKSLLRDAFKDDNILPETILYRKKHAFSDAIDGNDVCYHEEVEKYAKSVISEDEWNLRKQTYPVNTPISYESLYYRKIFEKHYPGRENLLTKFWLPSLKGVTSVNPSATSLAGHTIDTEF
jgi:asparagine synthase (glutamine-hydrolysing)